MALITPYLIVDAALILGTVIVTAFLFMTRKFKYWEKRGVLELTPTPFFGNFSDCLFQRTTPSEFVKSLYEMGKGHPYLGFYIFDKPFFMPRDPELVKSILVKDFNHFSDRYATPDTADRLGYANLFMIKNPAWKTLRAKLTPIFTSGKLKKMFDLMLDVAKDLEDHLDATVFDGNGKTVEMKDFCANFTTDLISTTAFGFKTNSLNNPDIEFREYGRLIFDYDVQRSIEFIAIFFIPSLVRLLRCNFFGKKSSNYLRSIFWDAIKERKKSGFKRNDLIDLLNELQEKYKDEDFGGFKFDGDDLVAQAAVFFTGGFETSSTTMSFTLYELALNPTIQNKARREILDALEKSGGKVTYEMVNSLPYLDMVVSETLRKHPPLGFLDRVTVTDYKIPNSDVVLPKGTPIYISMIGMHYDPEYFPDPETFDPERFTEENKRKRPNCVYFPFGEGPHICIGMRLGLIQSKLGLIQILKKYEVVPCDKTPIPLKLDPKALTTTALGGLYMTLRTLHTAAA